MSTTLSRASERKYGGGAGARARVGLGSRGLFAVDRPEGDRSRRGPCRHDRERQVKIKGVKQAIKLTNATATIAAGQSETLKLTPKGHQEGGQGSVQEEIDTAAREGKDVTATITVKIVDAAATRARSSGR